MKGRLGTALLLLIVFGAGLGMLYGGVHLVQVQTSGTPARATVTECHNGGFRNRTDVCTGTWVAGSQEPTASTQATALRDCFVAAGKRSTQPAAERLRAVARDADAPWPRRRTRACGARSPRHVRELVAARFV